MKLCIFGRHPIPQGGFNGVMSLFEAIGFSRLGYDTDLLLPFRDSSALEQFLDKHRLRALDELPRFGGNFEITPVYPDASSFPRCDVLVYQSYSHEDWELFSGIFPQRARLITKNFPKFVADARLDETVLSQLETFDLVACALQEDYELLGSMPGVRQDFAKSFAYVPRGASAIMLHAGYKAGLPPSIGFDVPNQNKIEALQHYIGPVEKLRKTIPELKVLTLGREIEEFRSQKVPFGQFDRVYESFFNCIHVYCTINYEHSPDHLQAPVQKRADGWSRRAVYEVQNIEAQMSGAVLVGHRDNLVPELYVPGVTGMNFRDFSDEAHIYSTLKSALDRWPALVSTIRRFAVESFNWPNSVRLWSEAIQTRLQYPLLRS